MKNTEELKQELIEHLKGKDIDDVMHLWAESKDYYINEKILMGGSYASWGTFIKVTLNIEGELYKFQVDLSEL